MSMLSEGRGFPLKSTAGASTDDPAPMAGEPGSSWKLSEAELMNCGSADTILLRTTSVSDGMRPSMRTPTEFRTMVLLMTSGALPCGSVRLTARQALSWNTLFSIVGDEPLMNETTPDRNWLSQELPVNRS